MSDSSGNNIVGLNVARLHQDRYIYAAADLVNANGGDWGYLTVVFTASERDGGAGEQLLQELLDRCYEQHLQPIIRVATRFDVESETWSRPEPDDAERWRAFLERGRWPTTQRLGDRRQRAEPRARVGRRGRFGGLRRSTSRTSSTCSPIPTASRS